MAKGKQKVENAKVDELRVNREEATDEYLTTNQGFRINDDQNSLKAGERGPSLLEDFILREKITHFDHERIPERVVHARGAAAHGYFQVYESMAPYTKAGFLQDPSVKTPVFVRFSTVAGSVDQAISPATFAALPSSSIRKRATMIWSATTCRCSSFRTQSSFPI